MGFRFIIFILFMLVVAAPVYADVSTASLILNFEDTAPFTDISTTDNKGDATQVADVTRDTTTYKYGAAAGTFDGDSGVLSYSTDSEWEACDMTTWSAWTLEFWVKTSNTGAAYLVCSGDANNNRWMLLLDELAKGVQFLAFDSSGQVVDCGDYAGVINDGDWHHVAVIRVSSAWGVYIDGTQTQSDTQSRNFVPGTSLWIGAKYDPQAPYFDGTIDELRIETSNVFSATPSAGDDTITVPLTGYTGSGAGASSNVQIIGGDMLL